MLYRYIPFIIGGLLLSSCVKKQIKQNSLSSDQISQVSVANVSTQSFKTENLLDETGGEANVRQEREISLETVYFDFDKYDLSNEAKEKLSANAKKIIENKYSVTIEGHCDERGTNHYNLSLGQKRANVVKDYYIRLGVPENKIATISYGEEKPVCFEHNEKCWSKNRRAETKVSK
jgi:peptidoglycan-associated lipoprotein